MRYREFYTEHISRADAEKYSIKLKQAMRDIKADERARHSVRDDDWLHTNDINDMNAHYALEDRLERQQKEKIEQNIKKRFGSKKAADTDIDAVFAYLKNKAYQRLLKHRKNH